MGKKFVSILLIVIDIVMLLLFVFVLTGFLRAFVGADIIEYENWNGQLEDPLSLRLGSGFWGLMFILVRMVIFVIAQKKILKGRSKPMLVIAVISHTVISVLCILYWLSFGDGPFFIEMLRTLFERIFLPE
jgi:hypothetical protein